MKNNYRLKQLILLLGDLTCFFIAFYSALSLRYFRFANKNDFLDLFLVFFILFILWIFINYTNELYKINKLKDRKTNFDLIIAAIFSFLISIVFFYIIPLSIAPKTILFLTITIAYLFSFFWRIFYKHKLTKTLNQKIIFLNQNEDVLELKKIILENPELGFQFCNQIINKAEDIFEICAKEKIDIIVINDEEKQKNVFVPDLYKLFLENKKIVNLSNFYENITGRITPNIFSEAWFLENIQDKNHAFNNRMNRLMDLFFAFFLLIIFILLLPIVSLAIKINSHGPVFFSQNRTGQNNKQFKIYKFRTMYALSKDGSAELNGFEFASKKDERITKVGNFLRKTRIDELPQVINLFKGELTLIGPRPERPEIIENLEEKMPCYNLRHIVKPGITGWAQVNQHYTDNIDSSLQKLQYDLYYIKNRSLILDISIIFKTINVILRGKGQ